MEDSQKETESVPDADKSADPIKDAAKKASQQDPKQS